MATLDDTIGTQGTTATGGEGAFTLDASASDPLTLPEGLNPATAEFSHEGPDMIMTWPDGSQVTVTDYFMVDPQPNLASDQGATVSGELAARLSGPVAPGMVAEIGSGVAEQPIGQVEKMTGTVTAVRADGTKVELKVGDQVFQGDILETGADGALGVILADETTFSMAEEGRMVLDEMIYDPGTQEGSVSLSVMHGVFTFVSGQVAKTDPDAMTLTTPVATIGIRGTQVGLDLTDGQNLKVALMEEADGFVGEVVIMNNGGVSVLNGANEFTSVSGYGFAPMDTTVMQSNDMINMFSSSLRYLPMNNKNVNDFGLQGNTVSDGLAPFEAVGSDPIGLAPIESVGDPVASFDTAGGGEQTTVDPANIIAAAEELVGTFLEPAPNPAPPVSAPTPAPDPTPAPTPTPTPPPTFIPESTPAPVTEPTPEPAVVEVTAVDAVGQEDGTISLDISVTATGTTVDSVTITGVPSGASLSAGAQNADGTWTVGVDQLSGLTITPTADFSGTLNLTVTATSAGGGVNSATMGVNVTPVADAPTLTINPSAGLEDTPINLNIASAETDADGSEVLLVTINNIPDGATLSAGMDNVVSNGDGTFSVSLSPAQLTGLQLTPPANYNGDITLNVTSTSTDTLGNLSDSASTSGGLTVSVAPVGDTVDIPVQPVSGAEDSPVALNITATATGGETIASVTISGVPTGATLSLGTDNGNGSWTLTNPTAAELSSLSMNPPADFSGSFNLTVSAVSSEGGVNSANMGVSITPVADAPTLTTAAATGAEDSAIALDITTATTDVDGSETLSVTIAGVPTGAALSAGTDNLDGTWTLTPDQLAGLTITPPANFNGTMNLSVTSTSTDTLGNVTDSASTPAVSMAVNVTAVADAPNLVVGSSSGAEDGVIGLNISAVGTGGVDVTSVTITGVPSGASLSAGTFNATTGAWTVAPADLATLSINPPADYAGTFSLNVTATSADGSTSTGTASVDVTPVADAPTLTTAAASGDEDTAIALNISTAETDVDGSEVLSMTIAGVPAGATLSAGTKNADGTWTLDPATDLANLTITPPANFNGSFDLIVTSTSTDGTDTASTSGSVTVDVAAVGDAPSLTVAPSTGAEDSAISLNISATGTGGVDVTSVTITGVPSGASLSAGTFNATTGAWTVAPADLATLSINPPADYAGSFDLSVTATSADGTDTTGSVNVGVTPVADAPTLSTAAATGAEDTAIALNISTAETDVDGSEVLSMTIGGVPTGATLSAGTKNADGTWTLDPATDLANLTITPPLNFNGTMNLSVTSTSTDTLGNVTDSASTTGSIAVNVTAVADGVTIGGTAAAGTEDNAIALDITATGTGGVAVSSITITGVPDGATLSVGTDNGGGSWTLTPDQLTGLSLNPPQDYSGSFDLNVSATSADGTVTTATSTVAVEAVADAPNLDTGIGAATEVGGGTVGASDYTDVTFGASDSDDDGDSKDDDGDSKDSKDDDGDGKDSDEGDNKSESIKGEDGDDVLSGKGGNDDLDGGKGDDVIFGGAGNDEIDGGKGDDILFGGSGDDYIEGGKGDDFLVGGAGSDTLDGGKGDDVLVAGEGNDHLIGGSGDDTAVFSGPRADYLITEMPDSNGQYVVEHLNGGSDGMNLIEGVEDFQFADGSFSLDDMMNSNPQNSESLTYDISIDAGTTDIDGSETLSDVTITGVPDGATFSAGTDNGGGSWTMSSADLPELSLNVTEDVSTDFSLTVSVTSTEPNGSEATTTSSIDVGLPDGWGVASDGLGVTSVDALDPLSQMFTDSDTLKVDGEEYDISSLTDGDSKDDYGDVAPLGTKNSDADYSADNTDTADGYSITSDTCTDDGSSGGAS